MYCRSEGDHQHLTCCMICRYCKMCSRNSHQCHNGNVNNIFRIPKIGKFHVQYVNQTMNSSHDDVITVFSQEIYQIASVMKSLMLLCRYLSRTIVSCKFVVSFNFWVEVDSMELANNIQNTNLLAITTEKVYAAIITSQSAVVV